VWHSVWHDAGLLNRIAAALALVACGALATAAVRWTAARPTFAIHRVVVAGPLTHADPSHIASVIQQGLRGTFFTIDLAASRDALGKVPWVRHVAVRRQWPATLEVALVEHVPLARWNDDALVDTEGDVFEAEYGDDLPDFYGTDGTSQELTQRYREFSAALKARRLGIDTLSRSPRGAWDVRLDNGLAIALGREQVAERWQRWVEISSRYGNALAQGGELVSIDMRYVNGFAARITGAPLIDEKRGGKDVARTTHIAKSGNDENSRPRPAQRG